MSLTLLTNAHIVNEGEIFEGCVLIEGEKIEAVFAQDAMAIPENVEKIDCGGDFLIPGVIDDQVHFREPGLTHKADMQSESAAAVAGGITSFMEMPNTVPQTLTQDLLEEKFRRAADVSLANYSFFMGASNTNLDQVLATDPVNVCGIKVFMGSSTGDMLVDDRSVLEKIFSKSKMLIATHCEDEQTIRENAAAFKQKYGEDMPVRFHPDIRSVEACYKSSSLAVELAKRHGARLHVLHISTAKECGLFDNSVPLADKRITAEACVHHLWFSNDDYDRLGTRIKWNPAVKTSADRAAIWAALLDDRIDIIATDHAPHTLEEKSKNYWNAPSGGPLVQHALPAMLHSVNEEKITLDRLVDKMCHAPAECFKIKDRGYIKAGCYADIVRVSLSKKTEVTKESLLYKCGWSPFEGTTFNGAVISTWVNGFLVYDHGRLNSSRKGKSLVFTP